MIVRTSCKVLVGSKVGCQQWQSIVSNCDTDTYELVYGKLCIVTCALECELSCMDAMVQMADKKMDFNM